MILWLLLRKNTTFRKAGISAVAFEKNSPPQDTCLIFAHRGSKCNRPENTLAAFQEALHVNSDGIELDVHLSKDNQLVVIHDEKVNRTTSGRGRVCDMTLAQLKQLDAGSWFDKAFHKEKIPTLEEVLNLLLKENFAGYLNIEIKTDIINYPGIEKQLFTLMNTQTFPFKVIYSSFNINTLRNLHALGIKDEIAYLAGKTFQRVDLTVVERFITSLHLKKNYVFRHKKLLAPDNKPIRLWGIHSEKDMCLAFQHNISGIFTDFPEKALKIRKNQSN